MPFDTREILIPLVGPGGKGALCRINADGHLPPPHPAHLDRAISELLECGLYQAGQQANVAVRRLKLKRDWLSGPAPGALFVTNPGDVIGLAPDNSASAELGLALARLMFIAQSPVRTALATGALEADHLSDDALVRPVHHLHSKFEIVRRYFSQPGTPQPPDIFLTPEFDIDGANLLERYSDSIRSLSSLGIRVVPVGRLSTAAHEVRAQRIARRPHQLWLQRSLIAAIGLVATAAAAWAFLERPIELEFLPETLKDGRIVSTPARMREDTSGSETFLPVCHHERGLPVFQVGDVLAVQIRSGHRDPQSIFVSRHYHVVLAVSSKSGAKVIPLPKSSDYESATSTEVIRFKLDIAEGPEEDNLIVVLARRLRPFDAAELEETLRRRLDPLKPSERLTAARNFLAGVAPGFLEFMFRTVDGKRTCS